MCFQTWLPDKGCRLQVTLGSVIPLTQLTNIYQIETSVADMQWYGLGVQTMHSAGVMDCI